MGIAAVACLDAASPALPRDLGIARRRAAGNDASEVAGVFAAEPAKRQPELPVTMHPPGGEEGGSVRGNV